MLVEKTTVVVVSFDLFGTLVAADRPSNPATAVAAELAARDVPVPTDWEQAYRESHVECAPGRELSLPHHVGAALASRGVTVGVRCVRRAVLSAFDTPVRRRPGAVEALARAREHGPVGLLSNCSVPGLVARTLDRAELDGFDAVVTSLDCGWRKPNRRAFEAVAAELAVPVADLRYVGDDPDIDGGIEAAGGTALLCSEVALSDISTVLGRARA